MLIVKLCIYGHLATAVLARWNELLTHVFYLNYWKLQQVAVGLKGGPLIYLFLLLLIIRYLKISTFILLDDINLMAWNCMKIIYLILYLPLIAHAATSLEWPILILSELYFWLLWKTVFLPLNYVTLGFLTSIYSIAIAFLIEITLMFDLLLQTN